ncbi:MAG: hydratase [Bacillota bacterium]
MVRIIDKPVYLANGSEIIEKEKSSLQGSREGTMAWQILSAHNAGDDKSLKITFDALASHDITYVGIVQTARASGLEKFPVPYVLTNCHNSLCSVGGTINEDDHVFGLSAAKKYGGIFVPAHQAVIHSYMREEMSGCGRMLLGSDSHTRYGALGTMGIGEGGPELVKQILSKTYDISRPDVVLIYLFGNTKPGVGPQDVALAIIGAVFKSGFVKNKIMEFAGPGVANLSVDFRNGIDAMTTETTCLSSIWATDEKVEQYFKTHKRADAYKRLAPAELAEYDGAVVVELDKVKPMIALPFHPSNTFTIDEVNENAFDILREAEIEGKKIIGNDSINFKLTDKIRDGKLYVDQGVIAGCAGGTFENIMMASEILKQGSMGTNDFWLSVYPGSQPINLALARNGTAAALLEAGVTMRTAFCGPCFGAGDVPANNSLSIRHTTRNFVNREGSKPSNGQISSVALMDARSIAATTANGGRLTSATEFGIAEKEFEYNFDDSPYRNRVYQGFGQAHTELELKFGPNIVDWPKITPLTENLLLEVVTVITDPVTTTDELIPSGETSSYRSNPLKLAEFTLSRKDPEYVGKAKAVQAFETGRLSNDKNFTALIDGVMAATKISGLHRGNTCVGSVVFANKPGDGSAREQAASCQRVLGGSANLALEYATKRYRSNLVNWGMCPFIMSEEDSKTLAIGDKILVTGLKTALNQGKTEFDATQINSRGDSKSLTLKLPGLTEDERDIILAGCLMNYYAGVKD